MTATDHPYLSDVGVPLLVVLSQSPPFFGASSFLVATLPFLLSTGPYFYEILPPFFTSHIPLSCVIVFLSPLVPLRRPVLPLTFLFPSRILLFPVPHLQLVILSELPLSQTSVLPVWTPSWLFRLNKPKWPTTL